MPDNKETGQPEGAGAAQPQSTSPQIGLVLQYVKDISFESPMAPQSLMPGQEMPQIEVNVDVQARPADEGRYEVSLRITGDASQKDQKVFVVEVIYAGLFVLQNFPEDQIQAVCLIECPRLLFPFARRIVADLTRDGGYPPLLLDPIDFAELFRQHAVRQQQKAQAGAGASGNGGAAVQ